MSSTSHVTAKEHFHTHWAFSWVPLFGAFIWFGMLLAMFATWAGIGKPYYVSMDSSIPYISDIGASFLQPLFITGGTITAISFFASVCIEKYLRKTGRLVPNMRRRESVFAWLAIAGGALGGLGLILLTIFDTVRHSSLHRLFLLLFILGVALSAIFSILEYRWISHDFNELHRLRAAYIAKGIIAGLFIVCAIVFGATLYEGSMRSDTTSTFVAGVFEWVISFGFTLYMITFWYDMHLSKGIHKGELSRANIAEHGVPAIGEGADGHHHSIANGNGHEIRQV